MSSTSLVLDPKDLTGTGNWNTTDTNWTGSVWNNATPDDAIFGASGVGTVSLTSAITAGSITIHDPGYTINTATFGLTLNTSITANESASIQSGGGSLILGANNLWTVADTKTLSVSSAISGTGVSLTKAGAGTVALSSGNNSYTGATTVNAGTLKLAYPGDSNGGVGTLAVGSSITVNSGGTLLGSAFNALGYGSAHSSDLLTINQGGALTVDAGTVLSMPYALNVVGGTISSVDGGHAEYGTIYYASTTGTFTSANDGTSATISAQRFNLQSAQFNVTDGNGAVDLNVTGTLMGGALVKNGGGTMALSNANTYTGATTVNAGILKLQGGAFSTTARAYAIAGHQLWPDTHRQPDRRSGWESNAAYWRRARSGDLFRQTHRQRLVGHDEFG